MTHVLRFTKISSIVNICDINTLCIETKSAVVSSGAVKVFSLQFELWRKSLSMAACRVLSSLKPKQLTLSNKFILPSSSIKRFYSETWEPKEAKTHTGQVWDKDDYRLVRFIDRPKQINTKFAVDLIDTVPPAPRKERVVSCDGGGGPTGHPRVYINLDKPGNHACGYCGLRFVKEDH